MSTDETRRRFIGTLGALGVTGFAGCLSGGSGGEETTEGEMTEGEMNEGTMTEGEMSGMEPMDPAEAETASVDRFSEDAGTLHVRSEENDLPGPDDPIDFDQERFFHQGYGPDGGTIQYYDFDVQPLAPAPIYVLFREGEDQPVEGQLNVIGVKPGDDGYNDFWQIHEVTVPEEYTANQLTSAGDIMDGDYEVEKTDTIKNCPVVPEGSTAEKRAGGSDPGLVEGWYDGKTINYFQFTESPLSVQNESVPLSPIYVTFNENPGEDGGGPPSGFMTEDGSIQNHNVTATVPSDDDYSPLWLVNVYDNEDFDMVEDLESAKNANVLANGAANVNCPLVDVAEMG